MLDFARVAAVGAYVMTAPDFEYGLNARRQMKASGTTPTLPQAEAMIQAWSGTHRS